MNVLVTGCGGDIGQSLGKILNEYKKINHLYGCDISDKNAGQFIFKNFFVSKPCSNVDYLNFLESIVIKHKIDLIIPISEPELRFFSDRKINKLKGKRLLMASSKAMTVGFDKALTAQYLKENGFPYLKTYPLEKFDDQLEFPFIIKSRTGSGSSSLIKVEENFELEFAKKKYNDAIVQEYASGDKGEYTCGLYRNKSGEVRSIVFKRELTGGYSGYGEVVEEEAITSVLSKLAKALNLEGSINVQLRLRNEAPLIFEINPRFSSTVLFRHKLGFSDVIWSIEDACFNEISAYKKPIPGTKFYKGFAEYVK